ncbi:MAG: cytochrome c3 family protein [Planctomycetes bacterium]|nr:cytochrome c3 family protein [Planctomycetota bacterium]MBL7042457.1 cytochrome c3 family protein [Pirellulaceae bacterium]
MRTLRRADIDWLMHYFTAPQRGTRDGPASSERVTFSLTAGHTLRASRWGAVKRPSALYRLVAILATLVIVISVGAAVQAQEESLEDYSCNFCHGEDGTLAGDEDNKHLIVTHEDLKADIHWQKGLRCHDCHGGNAKLDDYVDHREDSGFRPLQSAAEIPGFCGHCHSDKEYMRKFDPNAKLNHAADFLDSAHGKYLQSAAEDPRAASCISCHPKHETRSADDPESAIHPQRLAETCGACHPQQRDELLAGVHKKAGNGNGQGEKTFLDCNQCHGGNIHGMRPVADPESPVFVRNQVQSCGQCHEESLAAYIESVHGHGLEQSGLLTTAVCASCHGAHRILPAKDEGSTLHATKVAATCAQCHRFIEERLQHSVHGRGNGPGGASERAAPGGEVKRKPSCTDCHQGHDLPHPKSAAFRNHELDRCGDCHVDPSKSYTMSLHGQLTELGNVEGAKCSDCHGAHDILPISDDRSRLSPQNRVNTCQQCHPRAPANFASFDPHANHTDPERSRTLYYVFLSMELLLCSVFGFFGIHTGSWLIRSWLHRWKHGAPSRLVQGEAAYVRFEPIHRYLHVLIIVSFLGLSLTGLPLKYSAQPWAKWLATALGGFENTSILHRICAVITVLYFAVHLVWLAGKVFRCWADKMPWKTLVFGPDSPVPNVRDAKDFFGMVRWLLGRGARPTYERWTYWEKFDYWAVFWGVAIIGTSGLMMWFPELFCRFLPGWTLNVAKVIHSEEALLATGFIFAIHFFNTHLRAERFPMDMGMLTGLVSEEELEEERPEFVDRMREAETLDGLRATSPPKRVLWSIMLAGYVALAIGLALLVGMLLTLFG